MQLRNTRDFHSLTQNLGLTLNESKVYLYLNTTGLKSGSEIFRSLELDKSSAYRALNGLIDKNLVYSVGEARNQQFGANPTKSLFSLIEHQQERLAETKSQLTSITQELTEYAKEKYKQDQVTVFQGLEGFKQWNRSRIEKPGTTIRELSQREALINFFDTDASYDNYMRSYIAQRVSRGIHIKVLCGRNAVEDEFDISSETNLKQVRVIDQPFDAEATLSTWSDNTGFISFDKGISLAIVINDKYITAIINTLYDTLWSMSKPRG